MLQNPFYPTNDSYTTLTVDSLYGVSGVGNIGKPGTLTGARPQFIRFPAGQYAYNADRNNLAPSIGAAWQVPPSTGFMKWLRGSEEGDVVVRGGWAMAFQRPGLSDFTGVFGDNQGIAGVAAARSDQRHAADSAAQYADAAGGAGGDAAGGTRVDHHARQRLRPGHPAAVHPVVVGGLAAQGVARLGDRGALCRQPSEGTLGFDQPERAQHHQQRLPQRVPPGAGQPAGQHRRRPRRDVRLHGRGHGTSPLPIFLAHFNAQSAANAGNAALYTGAQLDQRDVPRLPRRAQSESVGLRDRRAPAD